VNYNVKEYVCYLPSRGETITVNAVTSFAARKKAAKIMRADLLDVCAWVNGEDDEISPRTNTGLHAG